MKALSITGAALAAAMALAITGCGGGNFTAHGADTVCGDFLNGTSAADTYPDITSGATVTVIDSASHVIGTGSLSATTLGTSTGDIYKFAVTIPAGETRYGIEIGRDRGTVWESEKQMRTGPSVSLGC
jgi:hypothetical protein